MYVCFESCPCNTNTGGLLILEDFKALHSMRACHMSPILPPTLPLPSITLLSHLIFLFPLRALSPILHKLQLQYIPLGETSMIFEFVICVHHLTQE